MKVKAMTANMTTSSGHAEQGWQARGRCTRCGMKVTGCVRVRSCGCGGRVAY